MDLHNTAHLADGIDTTVMSPGQFGDIAGKFNANSCVGHFDDVADLQVWYEIKGVHSTHASAPLFRTLVTPANVHQSRFFPDEGGKNGPSVPTNSPDAVMM